MFSLDDGPSIMSDFRKLSETFAASPQLALADLEEAAQAGVKLIINNRPDGEAPDEPQGADIESAANSLGMEYIAIPVSHAGFSLPQVDAMAQVLQEAEGQTLAYCRSGTRSALLWALARAKLGDDPRHLAAAAEAAGYSLAPVRPTLDMLAGHASD